MDDFSDFTYGETIIMKENLEKEKARKNLGEDVFQQDSKPKKVKHKAATDNGKTKLHEARYHRLRLCHPKEYFHPIPKKRDEIIRNFFSHGELQYAGASSASTKGRLHKRTALQTFEAFGKTTFHPGKSGMASSPTNTAGGRDHELWSHDASAVAFGLLHICDLESARRRQVGGEDDI
jgi:hypothetical protein